MEYLVNAISDIGQSRASNQDSVCVKKAIWGDSPVLMAIVCDGMGGLAKGELASAAVITEFNHWFETQLPLLLNQSSNTSSDVFIVQLQHVWRNLLNNTNERILHYGQQLGERLGTTFTGLFILDDFYLAVHIGDSRLYLLKDGVRLLTTDHTVVSREVKAGRMTEEEAKRSPKRSVLTQCVGASKQLKPEILTGRVLPESVFLLCSDGFRHKLTDRELEMAFYPLSITNEDRIYDICEELVNQVILHGEKDNISVVVLKAE